MSAARNNDQAAKVILIVLAVVIVAVFPIRMLWGLRGSTQDEIDRVNTELTEARTELSIARGVTADVDGYQQLVAAYGQALPPSVELASILDDFTTAAAASGVRFISVTPTAGSDTAQMATPQTTETPALDDVEVTPVGGGLQMVVMQTSVQATPSSLASFFGQLRDLDRLYVVTPTSFVWGSQAAPGLLVANVTVVAYVWVADPSIGATAQGLMPTAPPPAPPSSVVTTTTTSTTQPSPFPADVVIEPVADGQRCDGLDGAAGRTDTGQDMVCAPGVGESVWVAR